MMIDRVAEARKSTERVQAVVIGGGVVGCAVLRELAIYGVDAVLLEAEADLGLGSSKANSAILHSGYDAKPGTIEAALLRRSRELWPELIDELGVPFLPVGALMLGPTTDDRRRLVDEIVPIAEGHGVETEILDTAALREVAPFAAPDTAAALHIPAEGIVDPFWLTRAFAESAIAAGAEVRTSARVVGLEVEDDWVVVTLEGGERLAADQAIDCGGLYADAVARLAGDTSFTIRPRKGQFLVSETTFGVDRIVLPIPGPMGKGMLVTPIVFGGVLLGPTAEDIDDKLDRATDRETRTRILDSCATLVPDVRRMTPIRQFAGLRAASSTGDYILRPSTAGDRLHIVAGIRSTGISGSAAIAETVVRDVAAARGWVAPGSRRSMRPPEPDWSVVAGAIVCVCRSVAEAEVTTALNRPSPATTVDGLKRRCGVAFGDCQGNLCQMELVGRLADARGIDPWAVTKDVRGSWIVAESGGAGRSDGPWAPPPPAGTAPTAVDVVVIGGGAAGIGAALAVAEAGRSVTVVDRGARPGGSLLAITEPALAPEEEEALVAVREAIDSGGIGWRGSTTSIGLREYGPGWEIEIQDADGSMALTADQVVFAVGGYVTPREHRAIDGPRPSGVMTADAAAGALDRGWLPARRAVVVGAGRTAASIAERLRGAGATLVMADAADVEAVRGIGRLEGVRVGDRWIEADGLVLADALSPATFLLRDLGLVDEAPGRRAPAGPDGMMKPGLWAAGTCVSADMDHVGSLDDGRRVGRAAAAAVSATRPILGGVGGAVP
jgi:glycerol-3-phosphate dehydrogenase